MKKIIVIFSVLFGIGLNAAPTVYDMLMYGLNSGEIKFVQGAIFHGAKPDKQFLSDDMCLLMVGSRNCKAAIVKEMLEAKPSVVLKDANNRTVFWFAAGNNDSKVLKLLIEYTKRNFNKFLGRLILMSSNRYVGNWSSLMVAAFKNQFENVEEIIDCLVYLKLSAKDIAAFVNRKDSKGRTALHFAAENGNPNMANFLIRHGADVNAKDDNNDTPLHFAAKAANPKCAGTSGANYKEIISLFIENKADLTIKNNNKLTAKEIFQTYN